MHKSYIYRHLCQYQWSWFSHSFGVSASCQNWWLIVIQELMAQRENRQIELCVVWSLFVLFDIHIFWHFLKMRRKRESSLVNLGDLVIVADQCICMNCMFVFVSCLMNICVIWHYLKMTRKRGSSLGNLGDVVSACGKGPAGQVDHLGFYIFVKHNSSISCLHLQINILDFYSPNLKKDCCSVPNSSSGLIFVKIRAKSGQN